MEVSAFGVHVEKYYDEKIKLMIKVVDLLQTS